MAVYSELLAAGQFFGTALTTVFTAPATGVVVVRDVVFCPDTDGVGLVYLDVISGSAQSTIYCASINDGSSYHWQGRQVLLPGDELVVHASDFSQFRYRVTGYLLGG